MASRAMYFLLRTPGVPQSCIAILFFFFLIETETCRAVMLTWDGGTCIVECFITAESDQVEIFTEGRQREEVLIRGRPAEAYLGQGEGDSKYLLWMNENRDRMYLMNACLPLETMVRIAEGIREK